MTGLVYFAEIAQGPIKIGWSAKPAEKRISELQVGCPWQIHLIGSVPGQIRHERALHNRYPFSRMKGEWFQRTAGLEADIKEILLPGYQWPLAFCDLSDTAAIIESFGGAAAFGRAIKIPGFHSQTMKNRDCIPAGYWTRTVTAAAELGIENVTLKRLAKIAEEKFADGSLSKSGAAA